jgi:hypothetical protein
MQEVLLEWDKSNGKAPAPMLKDQFASERRKVCVCSAYVSILQDASIRQHTSAYVSVYSI